MPATRSALLLLILSLSSCSGGGAPVAVPSSAPSVAASTSSPPTPRSEPPARSAAPSSTGLPATPTKLSAAGNVFFRSPTGNLICGLGPDAAACSISESSFTPPPKPGDCEFDWGNDVSVGTSRSAQFDCVSDTARGSERSVLAYDSRTTNGRFTCTSSESTGISCSTMDGAHGFQLSRASYRVF